MAPSRQAAEAVAVGVVFVQGPTPQLAMSEAERGQAAAGIQDGLARAARQVPPAGQASAPAAGPTWVLDCKTVTIAAPAWPNAPWKGLPCALYQDRIDAALWRESNGKIYLFHQDWYVRLTGAVMDAGYPKPIADSWRGLPAAFRQGIDAAFWRKSNDRIYLFKGEQYVRLTETAMDPGYPQPIAGNWNGLPRTFEQGIDAVFMHHDSNKTYMFKDGRYLRLTGAAIDPGYPKAISGHFQGVPAHMEQGIQAALWRGSNDQLYLFSRSPGRTLTDYVRFGDLSGPVDPGYPKFVGGLDQEAAEALWRDPALAALGAGQGAEGRAAYLARLREALGTASALVVFVTRYPLGWPAYGTGPSIVMGWRGGEGFEAAFAREVGLLFSENRIKSTK